MTTTTNNCETGFRKRNWPGGRSRNRRMVFKGEGLFFPIFAICLKGARGLIWVQTVGRMFVQRGERNGRQVALIVPLTRSVPPS